ncbi:MAG: SMI1/KNR4 family protein [Pseudomonadota bacterium]
MELRDSLLTYLSKLEGIGWSLERYRLDGVGRAVIEDAIEAEFSSTAREQLIEYFSTINGVDTEQYETLDQQVLFPSYVPLSLSEAVEAFSFLSPDGQWGAGLYPFAADWSGNYLCVDTRSASDQTGSVVACVLGYLPAVISTSLTDYFDFYSECIDHGIVFLESQKYLEQDYDAVNSAAKEKFGSLRFWS